MDGLVKSLSALKFRRIFGDNISIQLTYGAKMVDYIVKFFTTGSAMDIASRVLQVVLMTAVFYTIFYYCKKRKIVPLAYILFGIIAAVFAVSFLPVDNLPFLVAIALGLTLVASLLFFSHDLRHDVFRFTWRRHFDNPDLGAEVSVDDLTNSVAEITKACQRLSKTNTGALIIVCDNISDTILDSGIRIDGVISADLLETIFFPKTPLHDGAVVISANKVLTAGCYLPLTQENNLPREFGTRHRAAIGVSEAFPNLTAIVVSEETGIISAVKDGKIKRYLGADQLKRILGNAMGLTDDGEKDNIWGVIEDEED